MSCVCDQNHVLESPQYTANDIHTNNLSKKFWKISLGLPNGGQNGFRSLKASRISLGNMKYLALMVYVLWLNTVKY